MGPRNSCVAHAERRSWKGEHQGLLFLLFRSDFFPCQDVYHSLLSSALTNVRKDVWTLQKRFPHQMGLPEMQGEKRQKADGTWGCEWAEYGTCVELFISNDIELYTVWNWNKWIQPEMAFQSLVLFHIQIPVLLRKENGRVSLFNCSKILGVGEVGNTMPMDLTRKLFSCWFNLVAIQKVTETTIWRNSMIQVLPVGFFAFSFYYFFLVV